MKQTAPAADCVRLGICRSENPSLRIGLNLLQARPAIGGAWKHIAGVVALLDRLDKSNSYIAYCNPESRTLIPDGSGMTVRVATGLTGSQLKRVFYENTWLARWARKDRLDLMHWFGNTQALVTTAPAVVTVHDLRSFENLREYKPSRMFHARLMIPWSAKRARLLLPVSNVTATALEKHFHVPPDRISVVPGPLGPEWHRAEREQIDAFRTKRALPSKFWLYVAHAYPHKNHRNLLAAYAELLKADPLAWPLVLRCDSRPGGADVDAMAEEFGIRKSVIRLPQLADNEMPLLYSAATALVFPSKYEGFGIPLVEALACGCPAIASSIPTTLELAGDKVLTCNPEDPASIRNAMDAFQRNPATLADYTARAEGCAADFHPDRIFELLMRAYRTAAASARRSATNQAELHRT